MPRTLATIRGEAQSDLLGRVPTADADRDYLAGGGGLRFPLSGQVVLSQAGDDLSRDLGLQVYDTMLYDATVWSCFSYLALGILAGEFRIVPTIKADQGPPPEPGSPEEADQEAAAWAADFCRRSVARLRTSPKTVSFDLLFAMVYGCKLAEQVYGEGDGEDAGLVVLEDLKVKPLRSWAFVVDAHGDVIAIRGTTAEGGILDLPPRKFLVLTWMPRDRDPRGRSIFRAAYNGWNLKVNVWPKYFRFLDRSAGPITIGTCADGTPEEPARDDRGNVIPGKFLTPTEAMAQMLARLESGSYAALRAGSSVQVVQATTEGEGFGAGIALFKREIVEAVLTSARAILEAQHGSKADGEVAQDASAMVVTYGRGLLAEAWKCQVLRPLLELNAGRQFADRFTPEVSFGESEKHDVSRDAAAYAAVGYYTDESQFPGIDAALGLRVRDARALQQHADALAQQAQAESAPAGTDQGAVVDSGAATDATDARTGQTGRPVTGGPPIGKRPGPRSSSG